MSEPRRRAGRPKDESKGTAILQAAGSCFLKAGFARTSMDAIAKKAGVSKLTLYSHFKNKDLLFKAMIAAKCREFTPPRSIATFADVEPRQALTEVGTGFVRLMTSPPVLALFRLVAVESVKNPKVAELLYETGPQRTLSQFADLLREWVARGLIEVPDPQRAAGHWFSLLRGMMYFRLTMSLGTQPTDADIRQHVEDCVDTFLRAYRRQTTAERKQ